MIAQINSTRESDGNGKTTLQQLTFDGDDHSSLSVRFKVSVWRICPKRRTTVGGYLTGLTAAACIVGHAAVVVAAY